ncbi:YtxH domain-containing protein [Herbiconiux moechotypicola]|uniref:YtxH domain-containing protein n=1 Tax=Herbiconiux moechotypicola TaxID=637393 RepID=A0ABN3DBV7_9MICO|nr:YtxH domain-containing protein [Herbiconiux moechotypicola]MCS5728851.1 YtxH domain-containing protein [Herbiconiux moechotypicola]
MRGKIIFAVGLATGYVLGTRAGRERYEQIKAGAEKVWNTPVVQSGVGKVQEFAGTRVDAVKAQLADTAKAALAGLLGRQPLTEPSQSTSTRSKPSSASRSSTTSPATTASSSRTTAAKKPAARKPAAAKSTAAKKPAATADSDTAADE